MVSAISAIPETPTRARPDWEGTEPIGNRRKARPEADDERLTVCNVYLIPFQINPKLFKIQPSRAKPCQRKSKQKAWISLDSLGGNEPFQGVIVTPWAKNLYRLHSSQLASLSHAFVPKHPPKVTRISVSHKQKALE
jgi:hypothetical protein